MRKSPHFNQIFTDKNRLTCRDRITIPAPKWVRFTRQSPCHPEKTIRNRPDTFDKPSQPVVETVRIFLSRATPILAAVALRFLTGVYSLCRAFVGLDGKEHEGRHY